MVWPQVALRQQNFSAAAALAAAVAQQPPSAAAVLTNYSSLMFANLLPMNAGFNVTGPPSLITRPRLSLRLFIPVVAK